MNWSLLNWWTDDGWGCGPFITSASYFSVPLDTILSFDEPGSLAHMINGIFTYMYRCFFLMVNLGKYTSPMDPVYIYIWSYGFKNLSLPHTGCASKDSKVNTPPKLGLRPENGSKTWGNSKNFEPSFFSDGENSENGGRHVFYKVGPQKNS